MEQNNTRQHYRRFEKLYQFFGVKTDLTEQDEEIIDKPVECSLKSWRTERAKRRVVTE